MSSAAALERRDVDNEHVGRRVERREDDAYLRASATYTDDIRHDGTVQLAFVRSSHAHATVDEIDVGPALAIDGVVAAYTWADIADSPSPGVLPIRTGSLERNVPGHPVLAIDRVRYHGQPVAAVVATGPYIAADAVDAVSVTYTPKTPVLDPVTAPDEDAPNVHDGVPDNVIARTGRGDPTATDRAFDCADHVTSITLENNRLIPNALEPRVAQARYDTVRDRFTVELASQSVHGHRRKLAETLGVPSRKLRVIAPSVGGGFGHKGHHHPGEAMAAWAARDLGRPVKWTATRRENYLEGAHGRDHHTEAAIALAADGRIRGLRVDTIANVGAYGLGGSAAMSGWYGSLLSSEYAIPAIHCATRGVFTNTCPIHSYRGAGRPEAIYVTERLVDAAAHELGFDPVTIRRHNLIPSDAFPYETAIGTTYDSGNYEPALDRALDGIEYDRLREAGRNRADGRLRGVGVACYTESTGGGHESAVVRLEPDGHVDVAVGTHSHGQGHETTYAQLVADVMERPLANVSVNEGDTTATPTGTGTFGSRSAVVGGNAVVSCAETVLDDARSLAADILGVDAVTLSYREGHFAADDESISLADLAARSYAWNAPDGVEPGFRTATSYAPDGTAYTFGTHAVEVAIEPDTGALDIVRYVAVDDCGRRINPTLVEGQVHGGVAQGLGQARSERTVYDESGRLATDRMLAYALPRSIDVPRIETEHTVTPAPGNELGVKGIGEAGTIAAPPALVNAVVDALADRGVRHVDMPVTDECIHQTIQSSD